MHSAFACGTLAILWCAIISPATAPKKSHVNPTPGIGTATAGAGGQREEGLMRCRVCSVEDSECGGNYFCARMKTLKGKCKCYPKPVPPELKLVPADSRSLRRNTEKGTGFYRKVAVDGPPFENWVMVEQPTQEMSIAFWENKALPDQPEIVVDFGFICWSQEDKLQNGKWPGVERCT